MVAPPDFSGIKPRMTPEMGAKLDLDWAAIDAALAEVKASAAHTESEISMLMSGLAAAEKLVSLMTTVANGVLAHKASGGQVSPSVDPVRLGAVDGLASRLSERLPALRGILASLGS